MNTKMRSGVQLAFIAPLLALSTLSHASGGIDLSAPIGDAQDFYFQIRTLLAIVGLVITTGGLFTGNSFLKLAGGFVMAIFAAVFLYDVGIVGYLGHTA